jgi:putative membrane protein
MNLILRWFINALVILLIAEIVPGITISSFWTALIVAIILGIINVTLKPILLLLTLPITILTLGLFTLIINALMLWLAAVSSKVSI